MKMWIVKNDIDSYWFDVVGAATPQDAARAYVANSKKAQLEEIEQSRREYEELKRLGRITATYEQSGFHVNVMLPDSLICAPMRDAAGYHSVSNGDAHLDDLFDWDKAETVRL